MAAAHSVSRWINQSEFQLSPSISGNNLGDIIKVPVCHSRGQGVLLSFSDSPSLPLLSQQQQWIKRNEHGCVVLGNTMKHLLVFFFFFSRGFVTTTAAWNIFYFLFSCCDSRLNRNSSNSIAISFPCFRPEIQLRALTWIQSASLLTTCLTSPTLPVEMMVCFRLCNPHLPLRCQCLFFDLTVMSLGAKMRARAPEEWLIWRLC